HTRSDRDWSSDVCSSDLALYVGASTLATLDASCARSACRAIAAEPATAPAPRKSLLLSCMYLPQPSSKPRYFAASAPPTVDDPEIGRASCRERVEMQVVV